MFVFSLADLLVEKLRLNVHISYMLVLLKFFNGAMETVNQSSSTASPTEPNGRNGRAHIMPPSAPTASPGDPSNSASPALSSLTVYGSLKQPEIVLFADPTEVDSRVVILHVCSYFHSCAFYSVHAYININMQYIIFSFRYNFDL